MKDCTHTKSNTTKDRILDAAEQLFADRGFAGASMRDITNRAGVNLSVIYYYFQSKEELFRAVIERNMLPVFDCENELFAAARAEFGSEPISLRRLIEIFVLPRFRHISDNAMRLNEMLFAQRDCSGLSALEPLVKKLRETRGVFEDEFSKTLPFLSRVELKMRITCLHLMLHGIQRFKVSLRGEFPRDVPDETYFEMLLRTFEAVFSATPVVPPASVSAPKQ